MSPTKAAAVDELRDRLAPLCESAVDPLEVAASLEADGLGDRAVRIRYGFADVFELAEHLYVGTARRPAEPPPDAGPWRAVPAEHILHGVLYTLPAICYPAVATSLTGTATLSGFVAIVMLSWALSQAVAYLGHARAGRLDPDGAQWVMRSAGAVALGVLWAVLDVITTTSRVPLGGLLFAGGQGTYLLAATVLLVRGKHWWLAGCLTPAVLAGAAYLALGRRLVPAPLIWSALLTTVLATCVLAATGRAGPPRRAHRPAAAECLGAARHGLFGLVAAGLLLYPLVATQLTGRTTVSAGLLALPLSLSMGVAEWSLYWYRRRTYRLLRRARSRPAFVRGARRALGGVLVRYLACAGVLVAATAAVLATAGRVPVAAAVPAGAAFVLLGGALFTALLLQAFGGDLATPLICAAGLAGEVAVTVARPVDPVLVQLVVCAVLLAALLIHAGGVLSTVVRHG